MSVQTTDKCTSEVVSDVYVANHGSVWLMHIQTPAAVEWVSENITEPTWWGVRAVVVEPRYVTQLMMGMSRDGLVIT